MIPSISVNEVINKNNIIDLRNAQNYNNNHIPNAINIPFEKLIANPSKYLNKNEVYYLYCRRGITSLKACKILRNMGFNTINIDGGYEKWILES